MQMAPPREMHHSSQPPAEGDPAVQEAIHGRQEVVTSSEHERRPEPPSDPRPRPGTLSAGGVVLILAGAGLQAFVLFMISVLVRLFMGPLLPLMIGGKHGAWSGSLVAISVFLAGSTWSGYRFNEHAILRSATAFLAVVLFDATFLSHAPLASILAMAVPHNILLCLATAAGMAACAVAAGLGEKVSERGVRLWLRDEFNEFRESIGLAPR
jgi:hypothetical protein